MKWLTELFRFDSSKYVLFLEAELSRLRDENQQLVNSCLANAGMQQIHRAVENKPAKPIQGRMMPSQLRRQYEADSRKILEYKEPMNA